MIQGGCHCGNIHWRFEPCRPFDELPVRRCTCAFCAKHGAFYTADPAGRLAVEVRDAGAVSVYRFGTHTTEPQVCRRCGVMPVVLTHIDEKLYGVVNLATAEGVHIAPGRVQEVNFENQPREERIARRRRTWIADVTLS